MSDVFTKKKRSQVMAAIRSCGNKDTEIKLKEILRLHKIKGWRRQQPITGKPDFVFQQEKLAVFVDGCFWHGCRWHCRMPKTRVSFWKNKIGANKKRDGFVTRTLRRKGWRVLRLWEHSLREPDKVVSKLQARLA